MIRINEIALSLSEEQNLIPAKIAAKLSIEEGDILSFSIFRESIDARKKPDVKLVYTVDVTLKSELEKEILSNHKTVLQTPEEEVVSPNKGSETLSGRPVVVGFGPCGMFAALTLAENGYRPIVLEQGKPVDERAKDVEEFWETGKLNPTSGVLFGEGGAGTFSDGKLTTQIKDKRIRQVLQAMVDAGAPSEILYKQKPHIGTDLLRQIVTNIRKRIEELGGEIHFNTKLDANYLAGDGSKLIITNQSASGDGSKCTPVVLAIGHSARDTVKWLHEEGLEMEQKPFSIGVRIEHPQGLIDETQYGKAAGHPKLEAAEYKLAHHCANGRGVYTVCMCPGGHVIAAASEKAMLVTNGMSYNDRSGSNANSALLVDVRKEDFGSDHPLAGIEFQKKWEQKAYELGGGDYVAPAQKVGNFLGMNQPKKKILEKQNQGKTKRDIEPTYKPGVKWVNLARCLPDFAVESMKEAIPMLSRKLKGFDDPGAIMTAIESRSSSPVRIVRDENYQSNVKGFYPAGEGSGYAGGITSAAVDGIKVAEKIIERFAPL